MLDQSTLDLSIAIGPLLPLILLLFTHLLLLHFLFLQQFILILESDAIMAKLHSFDDLIKDSSNLLGNLPILHRDLGHFFLHKGRHLLRIDFALRPLLKVESRPSFGYGLISCERFDDVDADTFEKHLIDYLVDVLVGGTHGIQEDSVGEDYLFLGDFLVAFRQDVIRVVL